MLSCSTNSDIFISESAVKETSKDLDYSADDVYMVSCEEDLIRLMALFDDSRDYFSIPTKIQPSTLTTRNLENPTVSGYTRMSSSKSMKIGFDTSFAKKYGFDIGTYVCEWKYVELDVNTKGKDFYDDKSEECGLKPIIEYGNNEGTDLESRGYKIVKAGNPTTIRTHVLYVYSTMSGTRVNRYIPTSPTNLKWKYILFK